VHRQVRQRDGAVRDAVVIATVRTELPFPVLLSFGTDRACVRIKRPLLVVCAKSSSSHIAQRLYPLDKMQHFAANRYTKTYFSFVHLSFFVTLTLLEQPAVLFIA